MLSRAPARGMVDLQRRFGPVCSFGFGSARTVFLFGADANRYMARNSSNFSWRGGYEILVPLAGETALLVSDGEPHRRRRKLIEPAITEVTGTTETMARQVDATVDAWRPGQVVELHAELRAAVRRTMIESLFGPWLAADDALLAGEIQAALGVLNHPVPVQQLLRAVPNPAWRRLERAVARIDERVRAEIARRHEAAPGEHDDLLSHLMDGTGAALNDTELRDMVVSLIVAAYDTTSAAVTWAVYAMLADAAIWQAARSEADERIADEPPTPDALASLTYLDRVVSEALRLYPPAMATARRAIDDFEFGGHRIRGGSLVVTSPYVTQRLPESWPRPERFMPERWDPDAPGYRRPNAYEYLPFGAGHRRCPGRSLAKVTIKAALVRLLRRADLRLLPQRIEPVGLSAMHPKNGLWVRVEAVRP